MFCRFSTLYIPMFGVQFGPVSGKAELEGLASAFRSIPLLAIAFWKVLIIVLQSMMAHTIWVFPIGITRPLTITGGPATDGSSAVYS